MAITDFEKAKSFILNSDLTPVVDRLIKIEKWAPDEAHEAVEQYRRYLILRKKYPKSNLPPSKDIDEAWHAHILHTKDYRDFCKKVFADEDGQYLDHHPHIAKEGSMERLNILFEKTQELYRAEFDTYIYKVKTNTIFGRMLRIIRNFLVSAFPTLEEATS